MSWIIEGKSDDGALRRDVQAKKTAGESCARFVNDDGRFGTWRYLFFRTETAIRNSHGNWEALVTAAGGGAGM